MKKQTAITTTDPAAIAQLNHITEQAGQAANKQAERMILTTREAGKSPQTIRRNRADIALFETYLNECGVPAQNLYDDPQAWHGITWGLVEGFKKWMHDEGYAIGSINVRLSTVRMFAELAAKVGAIPPEQSILIASVKGYAPSEGKHVDEKRRADGMDTRKGHKKAEAVTIPEDIAQQLKAQPDTPQGRRDALIMCLLLDHGLRVGEIAILTGASFDLKANTLTFFRPKVSKTQTHTLTGDTRRAAGLYLKHDAPAEGILWRRSNKGKLLDRRQMSETSATRAITKRVELLGRHAGIEGLSGHDGRHYWATFEARNGTPIDRLKDAGGWASAAMPLRYIEAARIANEGTARVKP